MTIMIRLPRDVAYLTNKLTHFCVRWRNEYLVGLRESHRMVDMKPALIEIGDAVLLHEESKERGLWKMGIVEECIVGKDGHIRGAKVRIPDKGKSETINRPIQKLFPSEITTREFARKE